MKILTSNVIIDRSNFYEIWCIDTKKCDEYFGQTKMLSRNILDFCFFSNAFFKAVFLFYIHYTEALLKIRARKLHVSKKKIGIFKRYLIGKRKPKSKITLSLT